MITNRKYSRCKSLNNSKVLDELSAFNPKKVNYSYLKNRYGYPSTNVVSASEAFEMMKDETSNYGQIVLVDARYDYEYRNCKIIGSTNCRTRASLGRLIKKAISGNTIFIFYCDKSMTRSKILSSAMVKYFETDPELQKPCKNITRLILEGGIEQFIKKYPELCQGSFLPRAEKKYVKNGQMKKCSSNFRREFLMNDVVPKKKMARAKSICPNHESNEILYLATH